MQALIRYTLYRQRQLPCVKEREMIAWRNSGGGFGVGEG